MDRFRRSLKGPDTRSHSAKWSHDLYSCSDHLAFTTIMFRSMQQQLRLAPPAPSAFVAGGVPASVSPSWQLTELSGCVTWCAFTCAPPDSLAHQLAAVRRFSITV
eukprot:jgi/Tetstr1/458221/TSEL_044709.t1